MVVFARLNVVLTVERVAGDVGCLSFGVKDDEDSDDCNDDGDADDDDVVDDDEYDEYDEVDQDNRPARVPLCRITHGDETGYDDVDDAGHHR